MKKRKVMPAPKPPDSFTAEQGKAAVYRVVKQKLALGKYVSGNGRTG